MSQIEPHLQANNASSKVPALQWWKPDERGGPKRAERLFGTMRFLEKQHNPRLRELRTYARQYSNAPLMGIDPGTFSGGNKTNTKTLRYNLIRMLLDTATAHIAKERPRTFVLAEDANFRIGQFAEQMSKLLLGIFQQNDVYDMGPQVFRDGGLAGTGHFKVGVHPRTMDMCIERVFAAELFWDYADSFRGKPRSLYHRYPLPRETVIATWGDTPTMRQKIHAAGSWAATTGNHAEQGNLADHIEVIEAWHLPSGPDAKDGVRAVVVEGAQLNRDDDSWKFDFFPFADFFWGTLPIYGCVGDSLASMVAGHHIALNTHLTNMEEAVRLGSRLRVWVPDDTKMPTQSIDDRIGAIYKYNAAAGPPVFDPGRSLSADWVQHALFIIDSAFQASGLSQLAVSGQTPRGLESGAALREHADIESVRFSTIQKAYEKCFLQLAHICMAFAHEFWSGEGKTVNVKGRNFIETINFDDIDLRKDCYELSVMPTSMLPKTVAGRMAMIDEWEQKGWIDKSEALQLMQMPDTDKAAALASASRDDIDKTIVRMLLDTPPGTAGMSEQEVADLLYMPPEPAQNLALGIRRMTEEYLRLRHTDLEEHRLGLLLRWIEDAQQLLAPPAPSQGAVPQPEVGQGPTPLPDGALTPQLAPPTVPQPELVPPGMIPSNGGQPF